MGLYTGQYTSLTKVIWEPLALSIAWWGLSLCLSLHIFVKQLCIRMIINSHITDTYRGGSLAVGALIIPLNSTHHHHPIITVKWPPRHHINRTHNEVVYGV